MVFLQLFVTTKRHRLGTSRLQSIKKKGGERKLGEQIKIKWWSTPIYQQSGERTRGRECVADSCKVRVTERGILGTDRVDADAERPGKKILLLGGRGRVSDRLKLSMFLCPGICGYSGITMDKSGYMYLEQMERQLFRADTPIVRCQDGH